MKVLNDLEMNCIGGADIHGTPIPGIPGATLRSLPAPAEIDLSKAPPVSGAIAGPKWPHCRPVVVPPIGFLPEEWKR